MAGKGLELAGLWMETLPRARRQNPHPSRTRRMETGSRPPSGDAPVPGGGGAAARVRWVGSLGSGVPGAEGSGCFLAGRDRERQTLGPRIQLWEGGFVSQTLPQRKAMEVEGVRNFKELRAKFQNKVDVSPLPRPTKFPASVSHKGDIGSSQSTHIFTSGKPLSSIQNQPPPNCSSGEPHPVKLQKMMSVQSSEIQKRSNSPGPLGGSSDSAINSQNSQKVSQPLDVNPSNAEKISKEKVVGTNSFRDKLWNWEKFSCQKSEMSSSILRANCGSRAFYLKEQKSMGLTLEKPTTMLETNATQTLPSQTHLMTQRKSLATSKDPSCLLFQHNKKIPENPSPGRSSAVSTSQPTYECEQASQALEKQHRQLPKMKPLPSVKSLGPPPPKPPKPPVVSLQVFQGKAAAIPKTQREAAAEEGILPLESAEFEEPHNYEATISYLRHSGNSINLCTTEEIADCDSMEEKLYNRVEATYEVGLEELQKCCKSFLHQELSPKHEDEDKKRMDKEPHEMEPRETQKDPHLNHLSMVGACEGTPGKIHKKEVRGDRRRLLLGKQEAETAVIQTKACPEGSKLTRYSQGHCGYVEALQATKETLVQGASKQSSTTEIYDDVENLRRERPKSDYYNSFASDSEENSEEMYDDVYKTKSNYSKTDLDGKETLKRLRQFFKKETYRFKMKKDKSKEHLSAFSISLPNIEFRSQGVMIYDDVDTSERESKEDDKLKTWRPKFLMPKENREKKGVEESEGLSLRNFFRIKKQNLEKKKLEKEEKLFRKRFEYDKQITVINTAVACSSNSRKGIFDLPITPGEELEVIDVTEENLVICRNSEGKYGYVLIEHLDFKHQGWSP
ncbi:FYN-binding protein 2 [Choloepus didactylus]|uniref:FYN-binding protein 2 n=1 Tax=Choloepus didactylus TaxID=27675 RepID=UPI00189F3DC0|nr:FYN-binding protein 2 [Choloepus didactylus]